MLENFALSLVKESGILLIQDYTIKFINPTLQSYLAVTGDEKSYNNLNLLNAETTFETTVNECLETKSTIEKYFRHGKFNYLVSFYFYDTGSCCCYFKIDTSGIFRGSITNEKPAEITPEFLLATLEQNMPTSTAICEYFPAEDDLFVHFMTKKSRERYNLPPSYKGIFANKDLHLSKELPLFQFAPKFVEQPDVRTHITEIPMMVKEKKTVLRVTLNFVGLSPRNNPVFSTIAEDVTAERLFEQQLDTKTQDLQKSLQTQNMLAHLCENIPILLGTVRVHMSEGKPRLEKLWQNAECDRNSEITKMMRETDQVKWIARYLESKKRGNTIHWEDHIGKYGNLIHAWCSASHLPGTENDYMFIVQDISPTKQLEKQLVRSKSELENTVLSRTRQLQDALEVQSRFLAVMSHEIRTPLSGILGNIHLLSETQLEEDQQDMLRTAKICGEQLLYLINDILDLTKMEENRLSLEMNPFTVDAVMEESIEIVAVNAEKKKIPLRCAPDPMMPKLLIGDAVRLRQIFVNLLSNSIKFSNKGEIVIKSKCLSLFETLATVQFSVVDQGEGIPDDVQKKIFQPFFQADSSTSRRYGGSGLGLNIAKRLTELMNGTIWFTSKIGVGTTFFFTVKLPIPGKFSEISKPIAVTQGIADLSINILVAEDNHINQRVIQRMLAGLGYKNVFVVENGELAVKEALNKRFHIVLMDCMMPIVSGFEATRMIRQRVSKENQPIIVALTADAFKENAQRCMDSGMDYVLYKPINKVQLSDALRKFCPLVLSADCVNKPE